MKKVLSLVLVLALVLGSFSMAFAAETKTTNLSDVPGNANEGAIVVANDLGIVTGYNDGTFKPANAVTRAEFAAMMTRALAIPESALKGFKTSSFKDVASDHWAVAYLGYCNSKGIMTGYEDGTARPNQTITVNEAITMICRALGYTANAKELVGTWPANYISLGQQLDLYDDVNAVATVDRASAAQIVYNALTCALVYIDNDGATKQKLEADGITPVLVLKGLGGKESNLGKGYVLTASDAKNATINVNKYVGSFVKTFDNDGHIIALEELSTTITGTLDTRATTFSTDDVDYDFDRANDADYTWYDNGIKRTDVVPYLVENGVTTAAGVTVTTHIPNDGDTSVTMAVDINGKKITAVYSVIQWTGSKVGQFADGDLDVAKRTLVVGDNGKFEFAKDNNGEIDTSSFVLLGVASLDKIAEDNIIEVWTGSNGKINKIAVGTKTVTGEVEKISKDGKAFYIDGVKYAYSTAIDATGQPSLGATGTAYLNYDGDIAVWDAEDATAGNYAIFLGARTDEGSTIADGTTKVGLVLKDGTTKELETVSGVIGTPAGVAVGDIVKYGLNDSGKLSKLIALTNNNVTTGVNSKTTVLDNKTISDNIIVFVKGDTIKDWELGNIKNYDADSDLVGAGSKYVLDGSKVVALATSTIALADDSLWGVINSVDTKMKDGDETDFITGFFAGKEFSGFVKSTVNTTISGIGAAYQGLYKIKVDATGVVTAFDNAPATSGQALGLVTKIDRTNSVVTVTNGAASTNSYDIADYAELYLYDKENGKWKLATVADIQKDMQIRLVKKGSKAYDEKVWDVVFFWEE